MELGRRAIFMSETNRLEIIELQSESKSLLVDDGQAGRMESRSKRYLAHIEITAPWRLILHKKGLCKTPPTNHPQYCLSFLWLLGLSRKTSVKKNILLFVPYIAIIFIVFFTQAFQSADKGEANGDGY